MNKEELTRLRKALSERRDWLRAEITNRLNEAQTSAAHRSTDLMDIASDSFDDELAMSMAKAEMEELAQIEEAFQKVNEGSYGLCDVCGEGIGFKRLKALPFASLCVECKRKEEEGALEVF